jgi:phosphatidylcholine synthase
VQKLQAMLVHVFTASGACVGMLALERAFARDYQAMFWWLALALLIDGVDGTLARRLKVRETLPHIDGDVLDAVVDYLTYVVVPLAAIWTSGMMSYPLAAVCIGAAALASALYFADTRMKTKDYWFRGFPALWNVAALYLFVFPLPQWAVALVLTLCLAAMFLPVVFVHPMRVTRLRYLTFAVTALWGAAAFWLIWINFADAFAARSILLAASLYFVLLPLARGSMWANPE